MPLQRRNNVDNRRSGFVLTILVAITIVVRPGDAWLPDSHELSRDNHRSFPRMGVPPSLSACSPALSVSSTLMSTTRLHVASQERQSSSSSSSSYDGADKNARPNNKKKSNKKRSKPRQKSLQPLRQTNKNGPHTTHPRLPPPDLTQYQLHTTAAQQHQRQDVASIGCPHFGLCSGCRVDQKVASDLPVIRSAKLYFGSPSVKQHRTNERYNHDSYSDYTDDDDSWYKVVVPSAVTGWRTQAKLAVAPSASSSTWSTKGCQLGLYRRGSHDVLPIPDCAVHHDSINRAVQILEQCTTECRTAAFDEDSREGGLRYVQLQVERTTGKVCLVLVWHAAQLKEAQPALSRLVKALQKADNNNNNQSLWHSIWCNCNDGMGNAIFHRNPRRWHRLAGPEYLREPLPTMSGDHSMGWLYFTPMTFRQGNMDGFSVLAVDVAKAVPSGAKVCELYAGVGVLGLTALAHHHQHTDTEPLAWVRCSDENPANPACFRRAVASLPALVTGETQGGAASPPGRFAARQQQATPSVEGLTLAEIAKLLEEGSDPFPETNVVATEPKTSYMVASATHALRVGQALGANVLIVDPPRRGLDDGVLDELCKPFNAKQPYVESSSLLPYEDDRIHWTNDVRTLIYVSCGFDALARDTDRLLTSRAGWQLDSATGYILFPGSDHVETVCVFQR